MSELFSILDEIKESMEISKANSEPLVLADWRSQAARNYDMLPLPNVRDKSWNKLLELKLPEDHYRLAEKPLIRYDRLPAGQDNLGGRIEIHEDRLEFRLDESASEKGVVLCDLEKASQEYPTILQRLPSTKAEKLAEFTGAASRHGFLLYIPRGYRMELPIEITTTLQTSGVVFPVQSLVILEEEAELTLISKQESPNLNGRTAISLTNWMLVVGDRAELRFLEIQNYGTTVWNFIDEHISVGQAASLESMLIDDGSRVLQRRFSSILQGADGKATITGIYTPNRGQVFTYDTQQIHNASGTASDLLFGGVLNDDAYSLWKGNVYVAAGTKGADGFQRNKNLLLSEQAHAESIPGLEIIADDVRCSHAVTLSSVDPEQLFFLQSRGIGEREAEELIVSGFLESASARIGDEQLKERVRNELNQGILIF